MFEWKVEDMALMNESGGLLVGKEKIYACESKTPREDKIAFVDSMQDGKLSYFLNLIEKFNVEKESMPKDKYGYVKTVSLRAWLMKNDTRNIIDKSHNYGQFYLLGCTRRITTNSQAYYDIHEDFVDEIFHRQLKKCVESERSYFLAHDEYSILKAEFKERSEKYNTTFGVIIAMSSDGSVSVCKDDCSESRAITIGELKYLLAKYDELDRLAAKITGETCIVF